MPTKLQHVSCSRRLRRTALVPGRAWLRAGLLASLLASLVASLLAVSACASVSTVRLQADAIATSPGLRPIAGIQADALSLYVLFIPVPGGVSLDRVVNQMLVATAKTMGADKIAHLRFDITPEQGIWTLRKLLGFRSARASGIAVQVTAVPPDQDADLGPEPPPAQ